MAAFFPLKRVNDVAKLFSAELKKAEPDLVMLSIVAGMIENTMTKVSDVNLEQSVEQHCDSPGGSEDMTSANLKIEPNVEWHLVEALHKKFEAVIKGYCEVNLLANATKTHPDPRDVRLLIKHVADIIWNTLSKAQYKDRPHLQSIYCYLTGNKLDCFGVAFTVVAACQLLRVHGVHLALSEDHAWVVFGKNGTETAEVTWHGKGNEDKRGQPVEIAKAKTAWLYVAGQPVVCDRHMEVAALVSSINPAINSNFDSIEVGGLQQELLWILYDNGHLKQYPMALDNLADLEEISPSLSRPSCLQLYEEAIEINRRVYDNHHVYPYTYLGGYYYRVKNYSKAIETWANAADVIKLYSYSKDDEEIYKEFMEIANELIPHILKSEDNRVPCDPQNFANILRFYDGICSWEEGSATPIMHIGWAKPMVSTCAKFEAKTRRLIEFATEKGNNPEEETSSDASSYWVNNNYYKKYYNGQYDEEDEDAMSNCDEAPIATNLVSPASSECAKEPIIALLSELCHSKVLNVDYLLGLSSQPFESRKSIKSNSRQLRRQQQHSSCAWGLKLETSPSSSIKDSSSEDTNDEKKSKVWLKLHSAKMIGLKDLLLSDKLSTNAIQLQLTALSQGTTSKTGASSSEFGGAEESFGGRPKRSRRE